MEAMKGDDTLTVSALSLQAGTRSADFNDLPFLAIESDGSPLTQQIHAKLEAFCMRALRLHHRMQQ
jgi:hypothetical protein